MREFLKTKKFKVILALTAIVIGVMIYTLSRGGYTSSSASFFDKIFEPINKLSTNISGKVSTSLDTLVNAQQYYEENQKLKEQLNELYGTIVDYDNLKRENEELRVMLGLKEKYEDFTFSPPCSIIARQTNDPYGTFTIDKGSNDGIKPYDPVITSQGLVGVCFDVSTSTSKVRTLYSPKTAVGVYTVRTKTTGIIEGDYSTADDGYCRMSYIDKESDIKAGDIVITSGSQNFPAEQLVGVVKETGIEDSGLSMYAIIEPAVNPGQITDVFVITKFKGQNEYLNDETE